MFGSLFCIAAIIACSPSVTMGMLDTRSLLKDGTCSCIIWKSFSWVCTNFLSCNKNATGIQGLSLNVIEFVKRGPIHASNFVILKEYNFIYK